MPIRVKSCNWVNAKSAKFRETLNRFFAEKGRHWVVHARKPSGQEAGYEEKRPGACLGEEPENITIEENERRRQGRDREEEEDAPLDPNLWGQEE